MSDLTPERLDEIEKAAKEATPGPWQTGSDGIDDGNAVYHSEGSTYVTQRVFRRWDAKYIATMDPATTLALLDRIGELEAIEARMVGVCEKTMSAEPNPHMPEWDKGAKDTAAAVLAAMGGEDAAA